ncbi:MAG: GNAT family N-acetyltransferase, partial [Chlamydiae bacterium]|nr:GNAT family N-acetyltransferase [Chlamydiota bacterium]
MNIFFKKVGLQHVAIIFSWLTQPHLQEFWDTTQPHKDDILIFANGRQSPSSYEDGLYSYFIAYADDQPYALLMMLKEKEEYDLPAIKKAHLSKTGSTYSLDYMIGNPDFLDKGLGAKTLNAFMNYVRTEIDSTTDTFFIDPEATNTRARHVYEKAGFVHVGDFIMEGN